ncbi:hypothetical protein QVD17_38609 [Tagetes erecta]|uniref:Uncharacterized protein n=1 Tax=Tagetes erecta TaxID=13708 RepID=A0AAD8NEE7_TARER|nr:hypothetical protein QVD17_38609 [Tagetes erecta]
MNDREKVTGRNKIRSERRRDQDDEGGGGREDYCRNEESPAIRGNPMAKAILNVLQTQTALGSRSRPISEKTRLQFGRNRLAQRSNLCCHKSPSLPPFAPSKVMLVGLELGSLLKLPLHHIGNCVQATDN